MKFFTKVVQSLYKSLKKEKIKGDEPSHGKGDERSVIKRYATVDFGVNTEVEAEIARSEKVSLLSHSPNALKRCAKSQDCIVSSPNASVKLVKVGDSISNSIYRLWAVQPSLPDGMMRHEWRLKDYAQIQTLHSTEFCVVKLAVCIKSMQTVVLKMYRPDVRPFQIHQVQREIEIHSHLKHDNIIQFYAAFSEEKQIVVVQEYNNSVDLVNYMRAHGLARLPESIVKRKIVPQLLAALDHIHSQEVCHRDVKLDNILINDILEIKLCDFGVSVDLKGGSSDVLWNGKLHGARGSEVPVKEKAQ